MFKFEYQILKGGERIGKWRDKLLCGTRALPGSTLRLHASVTPDNSWPTNNWPYTASAQEISDEEINSHLLTKVIIKYCTVCSSN
ncbi:hypothetical protein J6590_063055 [Homalodisca vitripennis]|nr:hypothetical protein J6590_063055 [Homalodisca vitripennis]